MNDFEQALLAVLASIDQRLEALVDAGASAAPNYQRRLADYTSFHWESIGAGVLERDEFGPAAVEWRGMRYTRRAPQNKFDAAIWFSKASGKDEDGAVRYDRLITFKEQAEPEPLGKKLAEMLKTTADSPTVVGDGPTVVGTRPQTAATENREQRTDDREQPASTPTAPAALQPTQAAPVAQAEEKRAAEAATASAPVMRNRSLDPDALKRWLGQEAKRWEGRAAGQNQIAAVARTLAALVPDAEVRHRLDAWLTGYPSLKEMPPAWVLALHGWMKPSKTNGPTDPWAAEEVALALDVMRTRDLQALAEANPQSSYAPQQDLLGGGE